MTNNPTNRCDFDAIVIGAGICGIYMAYSLKKLGMNFTVIERGADVGGTWQWNRYPGCRFDSESETYGYSFSKELLQEWDWKERFSAREDTEEYLQYVVKKFDLRKYMQFNLMFTAATWQEDGNYWRVTLSDGRNVTARFVLTAVGFLSCPTLPRYAGLDSFAGLSFHTYYHPREKVYYKNKRVAIIGTGSTGVQLISKIAKDVGTLTVFQRRPNWCAPLHNGALTSNEMADIKAHYDEIFEQCKNTPSGFKHDADPRALFEVDPEDREKFWEELYASPGFGIWLGNFKDVLVNEDANAEGSKFIEKKIRQRVNDPAIADQLVPKDHGFGTRRVPLETGYYEVYNQPNVRLVNLGETPIERITAKGLKTTNESFEFDIIVYATGFDAIIGTFDQMDIIGTGGARLKEKWSQGVATAYGLAVNGFPNFITLAGPQSGSVATNFPRGIEEAVEWTTSLLKFIRDHGYQRFEPTREIEEEWVDHVDRMAGKILFGRQKSWFTGYNSNVDRDFTPKAIVYAGGAIRYRQKIGDEADSGYPNFRLV